MEHSSLPPKSGQRPDRLFSIAEELTAELPNFRQTAVRLTTGLIYTAPVAPLLMLAATVHTFVVGRSASDAVVIGFIVGAVSWVIVAAVSIPLVAVDRANPSLHRELATRLTMLHVQHSERMSAELRQEVRALAGQLGVRLPDREVTRLVETDLAEALADAQAQAARAEARVTVVSALAAAAAEAADEVAAQAAESVEVTPEDSRPMRGDLP
jgi:hypothetical protein